jgi:hypothetical protein
MVQIIPARRDYVGESLRDFAESDAPARFGKAFGFNKKENEKREEKKKIEELLGPDFAGLPEDFQKLAYEAKLKEKKTANDLKSGENQVKAYESSYDLPEGSLDAYKDDPVTARIVARDLSNKLHPNEPKKTQASQPIDPDQLKIIKSIRETDEYKKADPLIKYQMLTDQGVSKENAQSESEIAMKQAENQHKMANEERTYHTSYSKEAEKNANSLRESLSKKEMALNHSRNAIEAGDIKFFSPDKLADSTGLDIFRTAKGAQLATAGKENLLSNMSKVGAKAQNIWFEQRLNSMFAKIGQSDEANLTVQEMLEGEVAMDQAYLSEFDRLTADDEQRYGFVKKDIEKRARDAVKPLEKEIFARTNYRMKELEEQEKGLSKLKGEVGKNVPKGTPLTLSMAKLYKDKFGDDAKNIIKKNGYYIPTLEEFQIYQERPQEFREGIVK